MAHKILNIERVHIFLDDSEKYCNLCQFKKYVNRDMGYCCLLLGGRIERDGANFIRPQQCIAKGAENHD